MGTKIMVVSSDAIFAERLAMMLRKESLEVESFSDLATTQQSICSMAYGLLIFDNSLLTNDDKLWMDLIKDQDLKLPILMLITSDELTELKVMDYRENTYFLTKPILYYNLLYKVIKILDPKISL